MISHFTVQTTYIDLLLFVMLRVSFHYLFDLPRDMFRTCTEYVWSTESKYSRVPELMVHADEAYLTTLK